MIAARFTRKYDELPISESLGPLIISDTPVLNDNIYPAPDPDEDTGSGAAARLTLGHLNMMALTFAVLALLMISLNVDNFIYELFALVNRVSESLESTNVGTPGDSATPLNALFDVTENFLTFGMPILVGVYLLLVLDRIRKKAITFLLQLPESDPVERAKLEEKREQGALGPIARHRIARRRWKDLRNLRVSTLIDMMSVRLSSTWALTGTIFLNRIRSLGYSLRENRKGVKDLIIKNEIYGIVEQENKASKHAPSAQMLAVAQRASTMETQLWYDDDDQLKDLVACGQFTTCYNLLEYVDRLRKARGQDDLKAALYSKFESDWNVLKTDPFVLIDELEREDSGRGMSESSPASKSRSASARRRCSLRRTGDLQADAPAA